MSQMLEELEKRLQAKNIHELRQVARAVGVHRPAGRTKDVMIDCVMQIAEGNLDPAAQSRRGAPPKSKEYDRPLAADILRCREISLFEKDGGVVSEVFFTVSSPDEDLLEFKSGGVLEKTDGKWFARGSNSEIFVNEKIIEINALKEGDYVSGVCKRAEVDQTAGLCALENVNGYPPNALPDRVDFSLLPSYYPDRKLNTGTVCDLLAPLGAGQRAAVIGAHGSGKTYFIKSVLKGITENHPEVKVIILLIDARSEEVEEFRALFPRADIFPSLMDAGAASHTHTAALALEYAKRQTELFRDVVFAVDGLTKLSRAEAHLSHASPTDGAKKILAAAKNAGEGSLTVLAALDKDSGKFDEEVYSELSGLCNTRVTLSKKLALARVYPPVDKLETYSSGAERLLSEEELTEAAALRNN